MPSMSGSNATESSHSSTSSGMSTAFLANALRILGHQGEKPSRDKAAPEPPPDAPAATGLAVPSAGNYNVPALPGSNPIIANSKVLVRSLRAGICLPVTLLVLQTAHVVHASFV